MMRKTKILLDSDVVIHFMKGGCFSLLFDIFPDYQYLILDVVYQELMKHKETKVFVDNNLTFMPNRITKETFAPQGEYRREYAMLQKNLGKGESACMVYCLEHNDVLGSSNLRDIKEYCERKNITYLTTLDFLYYAYVKKLMTAQECKTFMEAVNNSGSKMPIIDIETHTCTAQL